MFTKKMLYDVVEWDIYSWGRGIRYWDKLIDLSAKQEDGGGELSENSKRVLDIGARDGGTSLYFALKGFQVVCSDLLGPTDKAKMKHRGHGVSNAIEYKFVDCTAIGYENECFDIVTFKSVMGGVGCNKNNANILKAFDEMHRVLKPGGLLLFCENLEGSLFHQFARRHFVKWGKEWNYMPLGSMEKLLGRFSEYDIRTFGFLSCYFKNNLVAHWVDRKLNGWLAPKDQYMCYGYARK